MTAIDAGLLVDVGNTLIRRELPGPKQRALTWIETLRLANPPPREELTAAILTADDPAEAAQRVISLTGISRSKTAELERLLAGSDGAAQIQAGARELLSTARDQGWQVVFATNAVRWASPVPGELIAQDDLYVSSAEVGWPKQDIRYWKECVRRTGVHPQFAFSVGDSIDADVRSAENAGISAIHIKTGSTDLLDIADALTSIGPRPLQAVALLAGKAEIWASQSIVRAPQLEFLVDRVTRARTRLHTAGTSLPAMVIRRNSDTPAVHAIGSRQIRKLCLAWVVPKADGRMHTIPADLQNALRLAGASLDHLNATSRRHILAMVQESSDTLVRSERIRDIIQLLTGGNTPDV